MTKRKINVEALTDEQLNVAEIKIAERINKTMDLLTNKWNPLLKQYGVEIELQVVIDREDVVKITDKNVGNFFEKYKSDPKLGVVAQELDSMSRNMETDLNNAVKYCNELLSRYGMTCDMAFVSKD